MMLHNKELQSAGLLIKEIHYTICVSFNVYFEIIQYII